MKWLMVTMTKYMALFSRTISGTAQVIGKKKFDPSKKKDGFDFRGKTYIIETSNPAYQEKGTFVYLIDIENGQRTVDAPKGGVDPKLVQAMFTKETARQLVAGLQSAGNWMLALIIGVLGGVLGLFGGIILQAVTHIIGG